MVGKSNVEDILREMKNRIHDLESRGMGDVVPGQLRAIVGTISTADSASTATKSSSNAGLEWAGSGTSKRGNIQVGKTKAGARSEDGSSRDNSRPSTFLDFSEIQ